MSDVNTDDLRQQAERATVGGDWYVIYGKVANLLDMALDEIDRLREQESSDRIKGAKAVINEHLRTAKAEAERDRLRDGIRVAIAAVDPKLSKRILRELVDDDVD